MRRPFGPIPCQLDHAAVFGRRELARGLVEILLADDRVAPIDGLGPSSRPHGSPGSVRRCGGRPTGLPDGTSSESRQSMRAAPGVQAHGASEGGEGDDGASAPPRT